MMHSKNNLNKLFNPKSIAIVGATEKNGKVGNAVAKNILELGYGGDVFLVNPSHEVLFNHKCHASLESIGKNIDLAIIVVPSRMVNDVISKGSNNVKNFVVISAGFSETGEEGKKREDELSKIAVEKELNVLGPNCLGFINPKIKLNASFAGGMPNKGNIALVSQSGALAVALMDIARDKDINFSNIISIGNKAQIDEAQLLDYLVDDPNTKVIGLYIEGVKNGQEFMQSLQKISKIKPVVILKAGKTEKSQKAISSHTGALAGSDEIIDAVFYKYGIIRAENLENFFDLLGLISFAQIPRDNKVAVITNAGGPGVLVTDSFKNKIVKLADFEKNIKDKLRSFLPEESSMENPVDLLGDAREDRYKNALVTVNESNADSIICMLTPQDQTPVDKITDEIIKFKNKSKKNLITVFIGGERIIGAVKKLSENGIFNFPFPDRAIDALDKYCQWGIYQNEELVMAKEIINEDRRSRVGEIISRAKSEKRNALFFSETEDIMKIYDLKTVTTEVLTTNEEIKTKIEFPVVVKLDSIKILHKTDKQGVIIGIKDQQELEKAVNKIRSSFPEENVIIQSMQDIQMEIIVGIKRDAIFGPVIVFGLGGIYTEMFKLTGLLIPPMNMEEIKQQLLNSRIGFLFKETRGKNPYDIESLAQILSRVMSLSKEIEEIKELDVNPLLIYNDGKEAIMVDVKIII